MRNIFFFDSMLTPKIITFVYWLILFFAAIAGIAVISAAYDQGTFGMMLIGICIIIFGALSARIWCELMIVLFKIHENLKKLCDRQIL